MQKGGEDTSDEDEDEDDVARISGPGRNARLFFGFVLLFVVLFSAFSLILWGASKSYEPKVLVEVQFFRISLNLFRLVGETSQLDDSEFSKFCGLDMEK